MSRVRSILVLSPSEQLLLVVASVLFAVFSVVLRVGSVGATEAFARRLGEMGLARWPVENVDWALSTVESNVPGSGGCLPAAMVGLAISDELLELRFGVRDSEDSIEAHAWLKCPDGSLLYAGEHPSAFRLLDGE